ncbi:MAG: acyl-CoA dehydrogenase family protein [Hyphomicrobiales bacterium]|nr:acyl-CoA dehydrogenase family protein [Hyphomicrobiales bacterium]
MALVLNEEQSMLRDSARGLIADRGPVAQLRKLRDDRDASGFSRELWKEFADMGFAGILVPEENGGSALGHVEAGVVMEEIGRNLTSSPFLSTALLGATAMKRAGGARAGEILSKIAAGQILLALACDEKSKHNPHHVETRATRAGNGFTLKGAKTFVVDGHVADLILVVARTAGGVNDKEGVTLLAVDPKAKGVSVERTIMVDAHNAARITFDDVHVDADAVLGEVDNGARIVSDALNVGRAAVAAELVGVGDEAFDRTVAYLKERKQFGKAIGEFQGLQHRVSHLYCELEVTRAAVLKALQTLDQAPANAAPFVSLAKARACASTNLAVQEAVQMHGGIGMTDAVDIGLFMKRARVGQELFGDSRFHADRIARLRGY